MDTFNNIKNKTLGFVNEHPEICTLSLIFLACLFFLFFGIGFYPLIDVDETRYAVMARDLINSNDWNSLMLNGVPFLEKPPLYFWFVGASVKLFSAFNSFTVRFPIAVLSSFLVFFTYFFGKKVISRKFGIYASLTLLTSAFFIILSHVAILDMVLTVFMTSAIYFGLLTHFVEDKNKKYFWFLFYIFIGLGVLAKGILAIAIPGVIIFLCNLVTGKLKDIFKPINFLPGLLVFLAIIAPWHIAMYNKYHFEFIKQYILIHHFARFINSETIGRERPLLYFIPVFLMGFMPWAFTFIAQIAKGCKYTVNKIKNTQGKLFNKLCAVVTTENSEQKMILFAAISFITIFCVFSSSSTKLPTYILPAFPFAAILMGHYWWEADERGENSKAIHISTKIIAIVLLSAAIAGALLYSLITQELDLAGIWLNLSIVGLYLLGSFLILRVRVEKSLSLFIGYILIMIFVTSLAVNQIFNIVYRGGENELVEYSQYSYNLTPKNQLVTFDFAVKPSVMIHYRDKVNFITDPDFNKLDAALKLNNGQTFVIVKNKNFRDNNQYLNEINKRLNVIKIGKRYSLFYYTPKNESFLFYYLY